MNLSVPTDQPRLNHCWNIIGVNGDRSCAELATAIHCRNCAIYSQNGQELLDRQPPPGYQQEWTRLVAETKLAETKTVTTKSPKDQKSGLLSSTPFLEQRVILRPNATANIEGSTAPTITSQKIFSVVIFRLQKEWLALKANIFKEVTDISRIHTLPHRTNEILLGLVSIRGEIQLCVSLNHLLDLETHQASSPTVSQAVNSLIYQRLVVVEREGSRWVFPVDEIYGVQRFTAQDLRSAPMVISKSASTYTQGVFDWQATHVNYLDDELLFDTLNRRVL